MNDVGEMAGPRQPSKSRDVTVSPNERAILSYAWLQQERCRFQSVVAMKHADGAADGATRLASMLSGAQKSSHLAFSDEMALSNGENGF